jgi:hypothetical protein
MDTIGVPVFPRCRNPLEDRNRRRILGRRNKWNYLSIRSAITRGDRSRQSIPQTSGVSVANSYKGVKKSALPRNNSCWSILDG